ncbi:hypothetical protein QR680_010464 [Steinernema hermaphroditum]|uniref:Uncharacterized protein n=1 Tax=Steinernema hermaphroditum TaxID=289476 RepID=A0AA39IRR9_9BILA|nr:hypothetical protein QR680_010464 [Steinernema hermaphroditum]
MYLAYPQYYYNYFYGHPAYHYAPYSYTPREYAPEAYAPGQVYYYPMYDEEGRCFKGFWGDLKTKVGEIKEKIKNKMKGIIGRVFGKDEQVQPTRKIEEEKPATPEPVVEIPEEEVAEEQGFKSRLGLKTKIIPRGSSYTLLKRIYHEMPLKWDFCVTLNAAKESDSNTAFKTISETTYMKNLADNLDQLKENARAEWI